MGDSKVRVKYTQTAGGLKISAARSLKPISEIEDEALATGFKILRIVHDKAWFNDDDPGVRTLGWDRKCNLGSGDFNNDLYLTDHPGDVWSAQFDGRSVRLVAPTGPEYGRMRVCIDGKDCGEIDLGSSPPGKQQIVFRSRRLRRGGHLIEITSVDGVATIDALIIK